MAAESQEGVPTRSLAKPGQRPCAPSRRGDAASAGSHKSPYDAVAREYAEKFSDEMSKKPKDRDMLARFAREVQGRGLVCDMGCGPGQTAIHLSGLGVKVCGLDISHPMLVEARRLHRHLEFVQGDMLSLPLADNSLAGIIAFYAIVHFPPETLARAFREMARALSPDGWLLLTFHIGNETIHVEEFLGKRVPMDFVFFPTQAVARAIQAAGLALEQVIERDPYPGVEYQSRRAYVLARKHGT
ncbi:MAG: methyltransferase domain-containing protein [Planctomycetes bacterium]|nr:methyltransferase domain-containing protein [Planctomycetota bacterium]MBM4078385.1 methyltransferase domain-containing protein [Planctomycetota bacterium]MBM4084174.1 methyltransferase domain-containing protein [Planctomycetota bacterium]